MIKLSFAYLETFALQSTLKAVVSPILFSKRAEDLLLKVSLPKVFFAPVKSFEDEHRLFFPALNTPLPMLTIATLLLQFT